MSRYFNFYDPLEKRYVFNSFLVVVALVEVLILVFTLIWKIDFDGIFLEQARPPVPFPWKEYLLAAFTAPIVLVFLFGVVIRGFEMIAPEAQDQKDAGRSQGLKGWVRRYRWLLLAAAAALLLLGGLPALSLINNAVKGLGLWGAYLLIALFALALLYFPLRLLLRYRLQKKALEYQYLLTLAERHGVVLLDQKLASGIKNAGEGEQIASSAALPLPGPETVPEESER